MNRFSITACIACAFVLAAPAMSQDFDLSWHTIDCGGGQSAGGSFVVTGTAGQLDASQPIIGSVYSINGGFWYPAEIDPVCLTDLNDDGSVGPADLGGVLAAWGTNPGGPPDFDSNGNVGPEDLAQLLANWGLCP